MTKKGKREKKKQRKEGKKERTKKESGGKESQSMQGGLNPGEEGG